MKKSDQTLYALQQQLIKHLSSTTSWYILAQNTGIASHSTVSEYVDILDKIFVNFPLHHFSVDEQQVQVHKNKKIYYYDPIIYHAIRGKVDGFTDKFFPYAQENLTDLQTKAKMVENVVALHLRKQYQQIYYGMYQKNEVDFVSIYHGKAQYYEVKYRTRPKISDFAFWRRPDPLTILTPSYTFAKNTLNFQPVMQFLMDRENSLL